MWLDQIPLESRLAPSSRSLQSPNLPSPCSHVMLPRAPGMQPWTSLRAITLLPVYPWTPEMSDPRLPCAKPTYLIPRPPSSQPSQHQLRIPNLISHRFRSPKSHPLSNLNQGWGSSGCDPSWGRASLLWDLRNQKGSLAPKCSSGTSTG